ncbi:ABC transporter ATP-binding protein/permease [Granulosicoccaceae sp. 1_MG-2023]|nr:ABC transporter ATP-binding protein/permease [Granulosicoccaceae sp. 1_MG-2023]
MKPTQGRTEKPHSNRRDWENLRRLLPYIWSYRGRVAIALLCLVAAKLATVGVPLVLKHIIDALSPAGEAAVLMVPVFLVAAYGGLRVAGSLFSELRDVLFTRVRYHAMHQLSIDVLAHLHALSLRFHLERRTGAISADLERGSRSLSSVLNYLIFNIVPTAAEFVLVAFLLTSAYDPAYALVIFATVLTYIVFTLLFSGWRMQFRHEMNRYESRANGRAIDSLLNYESVRYFNSEQRELAAYDADLQRWAVAAGKSQFTMSLLNFGQSLIVTAGVASILWLATRDVAAGSISIGDLVMINALMLQLFVPLNILGVVYRSMQYALADMDRAVQLLRREPEIQDQPAAPDLQVREPTIEFRDVGFSYDGQRQILKGVSFSVAAGEKVAVVGPSGAGKSTIARLLFRFYDPLSGQVLVDGQDISQVTQASVREQIGIVPQDTALFNDTIAYNIRYARPQASDAEIRAAAQAASLDRFIDSLPDGYETVVGERGLKLSGGEKQRMAIARVVLKAPQIMVFDEATSSLDTRSEQAILEALNRLAKRTTTLVIAHRLSTIVDADRILVLDQGRIAESGPHEALLAQQGLYYQLWQLQQSAAPAGEEEPRL